MNPRARVMWGQSGGAASLGGSNLRQACVDSEGSLMASEERIVSRNARRCRASSSSAVGRRGSMREARVGPWPRATRLGIKHSRDADQNPIWAPAFGRGNG